MCQPAHHVPNALVSLTQHVLCVTARSLPGPLSIFTDIRKVRPVDFPQLLPAMSSVHTGLHD